MKKLSSYAGIFLLVVAACSNEPQIVSDVNNSDALVPVRVNVDGFSASQDDFPSTRVAEGVGSYSEINAVTLAFYNGSTEVEKITQLKSDPSTYTTFGSFSLSLPMGSYTMVALAYYTNENSVLTLTSPTEASFSLRARETFAKTTEITISSTNAVDISLTLERIISQLRVVSTDGKTADVTNVRMTFSAGGKDFNPTTGFALTNTGFANTVGNSVSVGTTSISSTILFLATDEQTMNVTIETLDAGGNTLFSKTVNNVSLKRNRRTTLTGAMYTNSGISGTFQVETGWLTETNESF